MNRCDAVEACRYDLGCEGFLDYTANPGPGYALSWLEDYADEMESEGDLGRYRADDLREAIGKCRRAIDGGE